MSDVREHTCMYVRLLGDMNTNKVYVSIQCEVRDENNNNQCYAQEVASCKNVEVNSAIMRMNMYVNMQCKARDKI